MKMPTWPILKFLKYITRILFFMLPQDKKFAPESIDDIDPET